MATTLDGISNGRAVLGIGAAWNEHEHKMYGIDFDTAPIRLAKLGKPDRRRVEVVAVHLVLVLVPRGANA